MDTTAERQAQGTVRLSPVLNVTVAVCLWSALLNVTATPRLFERYAYVEAIWPYVWISLPLVAVAIYFLFSRKVESHWKLILFFYVLSVAGLAATAGHEILSRKGLFEKVRIRQKDGSIREVYRVLEFPHMQPKLPYGGRTSR